jgi:exopolyphosphatase/guanosine-5'-triphosphate,3'-diphosphate pyrophosphatase
MRRSSIDIGSNSLVFLVVDVDGQTLHDEAVIVGLGKGLGDTGQFADQPMEAAMNAFGSFAKTAKTLGVDPQAIRAIATSAARRASNATGFFGRVRLQTGISIQIIEGLEEARLTWKGAIANLNLETHSVGVVDLGGGSTEVVLGDARRGAVVEQKSLEMGTVRLMEAFELAQSDRYDSDALARMRAHIDSLVAGVDWSNQPETLVAVAGTATTLGAMHAGLRAWDREAVHGSILTRIDLQAWYKQLANSCESERLEWAAVSPKRANLLVAGAAVLDAVAAAADVDRLIVSDGGIRHGVLLDD